MSERSNRQIWKRITQTKQMIKNKYNNMKTNRIFHFYTAWATVMFLLSVLTNRMNLMYPTALFVFIVGQFITLNNYVNNKSNDKTLILSSLIHTFPLIFLKYNITSGGLTTLVISLSIYIYMMGLERVYDIYLIQGAKKYLDIR